MEMKDNIGFGRFDSGGIYLIKVGKEERCNLSRVVVDDGLTT